jgi:hypothetical protein
MNEPALLLDLSIAQLKNLAVFFADEIGRNAQPTAPDPSSLEVRACREALLSISVLIPKLQAARYVVAEAAPQRACAHCDDD